MNSNLTEKTVVHYENAGRKGSTGYLNSMFEVAVHRAVYRGKKEIEYTTSSGKVDIRVGRSSWLEVKSCCSEVGYVDNPLAMIERAKYILYTPDLPDAETIKHNAIKCLETCYVFTPAQFIEMLCYIHVGGKTPHIKLNSNGRYNIQTMRSFNKKTGKWSEKPYSKFWEYVDNNDIPTATLDLIDSLRK